MKKGLPFVILGASVLLYSFLNFAQSEHKKHHRIKLSQASTTTQPATSVTATDDSGITRTITFHNQCPYPVNFAFVGGALMKGPNTLLPCNGDSDCAAGSRCNNHRCFWVMPKPANANYQLQPGQESNITVNANSLPIIYPPGLIWSGLFVGRKDCDGVKCAVADCPPNGGKQDCDPGVGAQQPATQAEFTFQTNVDFYDIEMINGVGIPVEMKPSPTQQRPLLSPPPDKNPSYWCGNPGGVTPITPNITPCTWNAFMPPSNEYLWVSAGGEPCKTSSDCKQTDAMCGLSFNPGFPPTDPNNGLIRKTCGKFLGFWTANEICGVTLASYGAPFFCSTPIPNQPGLNRSNLQKCDAGDLQASCYHGNATNTCCGCMDWQRVGVSVPETTEKCKAMNPNWVQNVLPTLKWIKQACPVSYTYPFDDVSSTFQCSNAANGEINNVNYTITFCPGGQTVSLPRCDSDTDCSKYPGTICKANMCVPGLGVGCNAPGGQQCPANQLCNADGSCQEIGGGPTPPPTPPTGKCSTGKDCSGDTPLCVFQPGHGEGECAAGKTCTNDENCGGGANTCKDGLCVTDKGCGYPEGRCQLKDSTLVSCAPSNYCPMLSSETPPTPPTPPPGTECKTNSDCHDRLLPVCTGGKCQPCTPGSITDCGSGGECIKTLGPVCVRAGAFCITGQKCPGEIDCPAMGDPHFGDPTNRRVYCPMAP